MLRTARIAVVPSSVALLFAATQGVSASIMVDDFSVDQAVASIAANGGFSDTTVPGPAANMLGGSRRMTIQTFNGVGDVSQVAEDGAYRLTKPTGTFTTSSLHWSAGGLDMTEGGASDRFEIVGASNGTVQVELIAFSSGFIEIARLQANLGPGLFHLYLPFNQFVPDGGANPVNFASITQIIGGVHVFDQGPAGATAVAIDRIQTVPSPISVLALAPLFLGRRRK